MAKRVEEVRKPCVQLAIDAIGREFGEQGRMPDCSKSMRHVQKEGPELISYIEGLHPLLGESKQHVQGRLTWSKTKLVIRSEVVGGEKEGFDFDCDDRSRDLADDWK